MTLTLWQKLLLPFYIILRILRVLLYLLMLGPILDFFFMVHWGFHRKSKYDQYMFEFMAGFPLTKEKSPW